MKRILFFAMINLFCFVINAQNSSVTEIRKKMATIRQSTDWNNAEAAKKANEEIKLLSKQLMMGAAMPNQSQNQTEYNMQDSSLEEHVAYRMKLWDQIWISAHQGEIEDIDLAKPLRDEIAEEYAEDESDKVNNQMYYQEMKFLCIDMSMNGIQQVIAQMEHFNSIEILLITGGENGVPVDLADLLQRAENYPLHTLYIINFKHFVQSIPASIAQFSQLKVMMLYNNQLEKLPDEIGAMTYLTKLHVDMNPLTEILPVISNLMLLETLGLSQTLISDIELKKIEQHLPNCKIVKQ